MTITAAEFAAACLDHFHQHQFAEANERARLGLEQFPEDGLLWQLHGNACWFLRDYETARSALETASALVPLQPLARCALAGSYAHTGEPLFAKETYVELLQDERCPAALLPRIAVGLGQLGEWWLALQTCRKLARLQPNHHAALFGLAYYMARLEYPSECYLRHLLRAHQLAPELLTYRVNLACLLAGMGQQEQAYELVRQVPAERIGCACWVRRIAAIAEQAGDETLQRVYEERLAQLR